MEVVQCILLPLILFMLTTAAFFFKKRGSHVANLPPGTTGWLFLGESLKFARDGYEKYITDGMKKYSPEVFQTSLLGERVAIFCGPQGNKFLFTNVNKLLDSWWPRSIKRTLLYPEFVEDPSIQVSVLTLGLKAYLFGAEALKQYIPVMDSLARGQIEQEWVPNKQVKVHPLSKKFTFDLACKLFINIEDPALLKKLAAPFGAVANGMFSVPIDLPGTAYNGALKGGKLVRDEILKIIRDRRKQLTEGKETEAKDALSRMLLAKDEEGNFWNEKVISNNILGLLVASYESTSSAVTFLLKHLAEYPHVYDQVYKEIMKIAKTKGPDELLTWEDIEMMKYSWNAARESLRVLPPGPGAFREAITEFKFAGFTIPKGWKAHWTVYSTHKNPDYFPEPDKFDPSRFEGSGPKPYTFVPFGGGP